MKSTIKNNHLALDVWSYIEECKMNGYEQGKSESMTATTNAIAAGKGYTAS